MPEFVNPKYADTAKKTFKKPTRLECMMQDYPKLLGTEAKVGFTTIPGWAAYSPCKNNAKDAAASAAAGVPGASPFTAESDQYNAYAELMRHMGIIIPMAAKQSCLGITAASGPCIVFSPETVMFPSDLRRVFPHPTQVSISARSVLVVDGDVRIQSLRLDGAVRLIASSGVMLSVVHPSSSNTIVNAGYEMIPYDPLTSTNSGVQTVDEIVKMRGYRYQKIEEKMVTTVVDSWSRLLQDLDSITLAESILDPSCNDMVANIVGSHKIDPSIPMTKAWSTMLHPASTATEESESVSMMHYPASVFSSLGNMFMSGINSALFTSSEDTGTVNEQSVVPRDLPISTTSRLSASEVDQTVATPVATVTMSPLKRRIQNKTNNKRFMFVLYNNQMGNNSSSGTPTKQSVGSLDKTSSSSQQRDIQLACMGIVLYLLVLLFSVFHQRIFDAAHTF